MEEEVYRPSLCLMNEIAKMYYISKLNENEISKKLDVSRPTVSRYLKHALKQGIVEIRITDFYQHCIMMEEEIKKIYPDCTVKVVPVSKENYTDLQLKKLVAIEGARYLQRNMKDGDVIGLAWGGTMHYFIRALNPSQKKRSAAISLHGSLSKGGEEYDVRYLVKRAAMSMGGGKYAMDIQGYQPDECTAMEMRRSREFKDYLTKFSHVDIAVCGAGGWQPGDHESALKTYYLTSQENTELEEKNCVGDFLLHFLDENGDIIDGMSERRTISISLEQYKKIPEKIVLLSGDQKVLVARAIMRSKLANILFIDASLAKKLCKIIM